jgi:hypothetical protein
MIDKETSREIREKIRHILMSEWDPIGVKEIPEASDEYDLYLGDVYALVVGNAGLSKIAEYLRWVEVERMEVVDERGAPLLAEKVRNSVATSLMALQPK